MLLKFNAVYRILEDAKSVIYRVVALPQGAATVFLYRLEDKHTGNADDTESAPQDAVGCSNTSRLVQFSTALLATLAQQNQIEELSIGLHPKYMRPADSLTEKELAIYERRREIARRFLDHEQVCAALVEARGIGKLIETIRGETAVSRPTCYRIWELLCRHGFHLSSLNPRFDRCGAPGKLRHWAMNKPKVGRKTNKERLDGKEEYPQCGVTEEVRQKIAAVYKVLRRNPTLTFQTIFDQVIEHCFVKDYSFKDGKLTPTQLPLGAYPNKAQVRRIANQESDRLARKLARTTVGHFNRNHRGLVGKSWDGVAGPGHQYAIDSTVGDIFLRSRVNRAWSIGRPVVYVIVDVWSTAVVGFHVCLTGPSWATAKVALFSAASGGISFSDLWGIDACAELTPRPTLPHAFLCDRGEYLSAGARATGDEIGVNMLYNPSYRPDLKGIVEVLHRIAKDQQFQFIPGAIDARRREIDLRTKPKDSVFTMDEYVLYLSEIFAQYNYFSDRSHRMTTDMISVGVDPSPAGLWRYGHEVGIGYQKDEPTARLLTSLLPKQAGIVRKDGVYFGGLKYDAPFVQEKNWSAFARNFGVHEYQMHYFPGNNSRIWWQDPECSDLRSLTLSPNALAAPGLSFDEWLDARAFDRLRQRDKEHTRVIASIEQRARLNESLRKAKEDTALAELEDVEPAPTLRQARSIEVSGVEVASQPEAAFASVSDDSNQVYDQMMSALFAIENQGDI